MFFHKNLISNLPNSSLFPITKHLTYLKSNWTRFDPTHTYFFLIHFQLNLALFTQKISYLHFAIFENQVKFLVFFYFALESASEGGAWQKKCALHKASIDCSFHKVESFEYYFENMIIYVWYE